MPETQVVLFQEGNGSVPVRDWLDELPAKAQDKCLARIERLAAMGHELRRPEADILRDGIHELRTRLGNIRYRMSHGFEKHRNQVPDREIDLARERMTKFQADPEKYTYRE